MPLHITWLYPSHTKLTWCHNSSIVCVCPININASPDLEQSPGVLAHSNSHAPCLLCSAVCIEIFCSFGTFGSYLESDGVETAHSPIVPEHALWPHSPIQNSGSSSLSKTDRPLWCLILPRVSHSPSLSACLCLLMPLYRTDIAPQLAICLAPLCVVCCYSACHITSQFPLSSFYGWFNLY